MMVCASVIAAPCCAHNLCETCETKHVHARMCKSQASPQRPPVAPTTSVGMKGAPTLLELVAAAAGLGGAAQNDKGLVEGGELEVTQQASLLHSSFEQVCVRVCLRV